MSAYIAATFSYGNVKADLGLWNCSSPSKLLLPLDTHLFNIGRRLKLTKLKTLSRKSLIEATKSLQEICPEDPIRYDFSLCRLGILRLKSRVPLISATYCGAP